MNNNKTKINLSFYKGEDLYSDGNIEDEILEIVKNNKNYDEIIYKDDRWPILYHLSPIRKNLLDWVEFKKDASLLEIGAGCGALTELLCTKLSRVEAVELSKRRADIISNRCEKFSNLEILVGNLNDIKFQDTFDYVTLIGVLEYAGKYTVSKNPYKDFLLNIKKLISKEGQLIIAIENKLGLKYWAGAREDHVGELFTGIEDYQKIDGIRTFGKVEMTDLLKSVGFNDIKFYYPYPDYKLPEQIFSDEKLPEIKDLSPTTFSYDQDRLVLFNEKLAFKSVIENNLFDIFSNSFLIFAR